MKTNSAWKKKWSRPGASIPAGLALVLSLCVTARSPVGQQEQDEIARKVQNASAMEMAQDPADWRALLQSDNPEDRTQGRRLVLQERAEVIRSLIDMVNAPVEDGEQFLLSTRRNNAITMLGSLRASEGIPALIEWLTPKEGQSMVVFGAEHSAASVALKEIGLPAVDPLTNVISEEGISIRGKEALRIIVNITKKEVAILLLRQRLDATSEPKSRDNITACLKLIDS